MAKTTGRKKRIIITTAAMLAIGGGAAFAYWTSVAEQNAVVESTDTSEEFTITVGSLASNVLSPGGPTQSVSFTVNNPGSGVQKINAVAVTVADEKGTLWDSGSGCSYADFAITANTLAATELLPGASTTGTVTLQMINRPGVNQNGCKGVSVPLHFVAS